MGKSEITFSMVIFRLVETLTLIIIFISIAQLCNKNEYGYKSLKRIDSEKTSNEFKNLIRDRIKFSRKTNYVNLIFSSIIYLYYNIRINPGKHISKKVFYFFNIFILVLILSEIILNSVTIAQFKSLSYEEKYFKTGYYGWYGYIEYDQFYEYKNFGKKNLNLEATILSFNALQFILIVIASIIMKNDLHSDCPMNCRDCIELFFASENEQNRENLGKINHTHEEKRKNPKEINELKKENEKLKNMIKNLEIENNKYKKNERIVFLIKYYILNKHKEQLSTEPMLENFIKDINEKYKENIEINNLKQIAIMYIKEKLIENLTCPISQDIFVNPYIAPEGQTFDKTKIYEVIEKKGLNPLTNSKLEINQLILNRKVLDIVEFYKNNKDNFDEKACLRLKEILTNNENKYYENPIVLSSGENTGMTVEGNADKKYKNLIVKSLIEQLGEYLDEYIQNNSNKNKKINFSRVIPNMNNSENRNLEDEF